MTDSTREIARDLVDQIWEDLQDRKGMLEEVDPDIQLEILVAWYNIAEGVLDGYTATIK